MIEFKLLTGPELNAVDPEGIEWPWDTFAYVAIEDGKVVGRTCMLNMPMIEGTTVAPEKRGGTLAYRLIQKIEEFYRSLGKSYAWAMADNNQPEVAGYLERTGYKKVNFTLYMKDLTAKEKAA